MICLWVSLMDMKTLVRAYSISLLTRRPLNQSIPPTQFFVPFFRIPQCFGQIKSWNMVCLVLNILYVQAMELKAQLLWAHLSYRITWYRSPIASGDLKPIASYFAPATTRNYAHEYGCNCSTAVYVIYSRDFARNLDSHMRKPYNGVIGIPTNSKDV